MTEFKSILKVELSDFLSLRQVSKSKSTFDHDRHALRNFDEYLISIDCNSKHLSEDQLIGWILTLEGKSSSIANVIICIRLFLENLKSYGINAFIPSIPKIRDDYVPYIFSDTEMVLLFNIADSLQKVKPIKNIFIHHEFPMVLRLMYGCGLRAGETLSLKMKNIELDIGVLILENTKCDKQRFVPMHPSLSNILERYCIAMGILGYPDANLFPTIDLTESVSVHNAQHKFNGILKQAGISLAGKKKRQRGPCMHCLRHVFVFKSFRNAEIVGRNINDAIPYLSIYLGHDSLKETEKYLKFSSELFPEAMELFEAYTATVFPEVNYDGE